MEDAVRLLLRERRYAEAFEQLLDLHEARVLRMATAILRDTGRAEEVTQDVFLKLWVALPRYDGRAAPSTWLYTIARNTCYNAARAESLRRTVMLDDLPEPAASGTQDSVAAGLVRSLRTLPDIQQEIITLFYLQEKSVKDVAALLGLPEGTVKSHLHRARRTLGSLLG